MPDMSQEINQWLSLIDGEREELIEMAVRTNALIEQAVEDYNYLTGDEATRRLETLKQLWDLDYNSGVAYAEKQGLKKGIKEGKEEGRKEGIKETAKKIAEEMLKENFTVEQVEKITKLSQKEIEEIQNNISK